MCFTTKIPSFAKALFLVLGVALVACDKSVVEVPDKSSVTFAIDWSGVKAADQVASASVYLYPSNGESPLILNGVSATKTTIEVPSGTYRVIAYNENLSTIKLRSSGSYATFEAYLPTVARDDAGSGASKNPATRTFVPSSEYLHLLTGTANRELIVDGGVPYNFTLRPKTATSTYRFTINIPSRLDYSEVVAVLGGVASRMGLFEAKPLASDISSVDIPLTPTLNDRKDTLICRGAVETFGVDPSNRNAWSNTLFLKLTPREVDPGVKTDYEIDLTSYFDKYNNLNLDIDVKVESPDPTRPTEVEFVITVKPWIIEDGGHVDVEPSETIKITQ